MIPTSSRSAEGPARLRGIDACRGLAAILVVLFHTEVTVSKPKYFASDPFHGACLFGCRGVDFFFVLSGFIITYAHWNDFGQASRLAAYAYKRFVRIFPILWVVVTPLLAASFFVKSESASRLPGERIEVVVTSLLLLPSHRLPIPSVVWTLKHEFFFYTLFACAIWKPKVGVAGLAVWFLLCISHALDGRYSNFLTDFYFSSYNLEFMLGVGCGVALRSWRVPLPAIVAAAGVALFGYAAASYVSVEFPQPWITNGTTLFQVVQFGLASVLIVLGVGQMDLDRKVRVPALFGLLGAASYSIYLVHFSLISMFCKLLKRLSASLPLTPAVAAIVLVLASVAGGILVHKLVEAPLVKALRRPALKPRLDDV